MEGEGVVHVIYQNRGVRLRSFCRNEWWNVSQVTRAEFPQATCLFCITHPVAWCRLKDTR
jgi:hypothetical protein